MEAVFFDQLNQLLNDNKLRELRSTLIEMNSADVAEFMTDLPENKLILVFRILPKDLAADVFSYLETETQTSIVSSINDVELGFLVEELYVDDAVDFLEEVPASVVKRVLQSASSERRNIINRFLKYPENSAGSVMTIEMVEFHTRINVKQALKIIRRDRASTRKPSIPAMLSTISAILWGSYPSAVCFLPTRKPRSPT